MYKTSIWVPLFLAVASAGCEHAKPPVVASQADVALAPPTDFAGPASTQSPPTRKATPLPPIDSSNAHTKAVAATTASIKPRSTQSLDELLLFFPVKYPDGDWEPKGLNYADVSITAGDGTRLHGWYCPADNPRAYVLIAHGNGGNVTHRAGLLRVLQSRLRATALVFDYRGYGRSEGTPTVEGVVSDARAARTALAERARVNEADIVLLGESLGGAVAVQLAAEKPPRGLVLDRTFSSLKDIAAHHYPALAWLVPGKKLNSVAQISRYKGPLLQCHGDADRTIPFALGVKLFEAASEPKQFIRLANTDHNDPLPEDYFAQLDAFIGKL